MSEEARKKFQTYLFFLRHFDRLIREGRDNTSQEHLVSAVIEEQHPLLNGVAVQTLAPARVADIRKLLFNAWNSETAARINSLFDPEVRVITNQWKPIQTYYALYFLLAAIHKLSVPDRRHTHETTLRFAVQTLGHYFPSPWCCHYDFDGGQCSKFPWPTLPQVGSGWNIKNHDDPHVFVVHFYRTTGQEKRYERWLEHGKKKKHPNGHPRAGKIIRITDKNGGVIGFWDVLWRMRKWVNLSS
jgi:hypothetical protein